MYCTQLNEAVKRTSMVWCKTAVSPLLTHWRYCSLPLSHRHVPLLSRPSLLQIMVSGLLLIWPMGTYIFMLKMNLWSRLQIAAILPRSQYVKQWLEVSAAPYLHHPPSWSDQCQLQSQPSWPPSWTEQPRSRPRNPASPVHSRGITCYKTPLIARFIGPTWGPLGADRTQVGPMLAPWALLSGTVCGTLEPPSL